MSGFTPGPYKREGNFVYALTEYHLPTGKVVEANRIWASVCPGHECPRDEAEATARLFQAAPELLENLQGCMEALASYAPGCIEVECARAAIAKATGEQP